MTLKDLQKITKMIVAEAHQLNAIHTDEHNVPVNYACIFAQNTTEYEEMVNIIRSIGKIVENTVMGPIFYIKPIMTVAGKLRLLKIRRPDPKRPERGDADFTVPDFYTFKKTFLGKPGFSLIVRVNMEMLELIDPTFNVLAYYSHPTLAEVLNLKTG